MFSLKSLLIQRNQIPSVSFCPLQTFLARLSRRTAGVTRFIDSVYLGTFPPSASKPSSPYSHVGLLLAPNSLTSSTSVSSCPLQTSLSLLSCMVSSGTQFIDSVYLGLLQFSAKLSIWSLAQGAVAFGLLTPYTSVSYYPLHTFLPGVSCRAAGSTSL